MNKSSRHVYPAPSPFLLPLPLAASPPPIPVSGQHTSHVAPLAGVRASRSVDVTFSAVTADLRCGEGTELILYLEPGTVLSRPFTEADTHDSETGELRELMRVREGAWCCC